MFDLWHDRINKGTMSMTLVVSCESYRAAMRNACQGTGTVH